MLKPLTLDYAWGYLRKGRSEVFWGPHKTGYSLYAVELAYLPIPSRPKFRRQLEQFLAVPGVEPLEVIAVTGVTDGGPWFCLSTDRAEEVFRAVHFNLYREITQLRVLGRAYKKRARELLEVARPYTLGASLQDGQVWLDFYWSNPDLLNPEPDFHPICLSGPLAERGYSLGRTEVASDGTET